MNLAAHKTSDAWVSENPTLHSRFVKSHTVPAIVATQSRKPLEMPSKQRTELEDALLYTFDPHFNTHIRGCRLGIFWALHRSLGLAGRWLP
jgi:hypothetical protein